MSTSANHHAFMQALMARRVMTETDARELYRELCRVDNGVCVSGWLELRAHGHFSVLGLRVTQLSTSPAH